jgi:hypothetical protein
MIQVIQSIYPGTCQNQTHVSDDRRLQGCFVVDPMIPPANARHFSATTSPSDPTSTAHNYVTALVGALATNLYKPACRTPPLQSTTSSLPTTSKNQTSRTSSPPLQSNRPLSPHSRPSTSPPQPAYKEATIRKQPCPSIQQKRPLPEVRSFPSPPS